MSAPKAAFAVLWLAACGSPNASPAGHDAAVDDHHAVMEAAPVMEVPPVASAAGGAGAAGLAPANAGGAGARAAQTASASPSVSAGVVAMEPPPMAAEAGAGAAGQEAAAGMGAAPSQLCAAMVARAQELIDALDADALKSAVLQPFDQRHRFAYEPQVADRPGASLAMLSEPQQQQALALLRSGLSEAGFEKAETTRALENLKAATGFQINQRDPGYYWLAIYGEPSETGEWGWQFEGHHLALHFTLKACALSDTPTFMGAWPAEPRTMVSGGPPAGSRNLAQEEELGRALAKSIDADAAKRMQAFQATAYRQMLPQGPTPAQPMMPSGLPGSAMSEAERTQLKAIVSHYASAMHAELAAARLQRIEEHGGFDSVSFVWTGSLEPKQRHFYRVQGPSFFIEYRNDDGDHIHTAWRDFQGDWGDDLP